MAQALLLATHVNRRHLQLAISFNEIDRVTILRGSILAIGLEIDRSQECGERHGAVARNAQVIKLEFGDGVIHPFNVGDGLGFVERLTARPGFDVILVQNSLKEGRVAANLGVHGCSQQRKYRIFILMPAR